jgi:hypothetical protein
MFKRLAFVGVLITSAMFAPLIPANAAAGFMVDGRGASKCSQVTTDYAARPTATANDMMGWAYGYMTRRNMERSAASLQQVTLQTDGFGPVEMVAMMLKFCQDHPDVRYVSAVDALFEVLAEKQGLTS